MASLNNLPMGIMQGYTAAQWTSANPILPPFILGVESDTGKAKLGDGTTAWASISSYFDPSGGVSGAAWGSITGTLSAQTDLNTALGLKAPLISPSFTTPALGVATGTSLAATGLIKSSSPSAGVGYAIGAGVAGVQGTSRTTTVVANGICGSITLFSAAGSATPFSFTVTNSSVVATDVIHISQKSGTDLYTTQVVTAVGTGSFQVTLANASGTTTETPVFNFAVIKAVAA